MVKQCSEYQRKCYEEMRQQIVDYFCPDKSVLVVESVLAQIRMKAATMPMPMHVCTFPSRRIIDGHTNTSGEVRFR